MGETIAILIIFFLFVGFGLTFYFKIVESGANTQAIEGAETVAVQIAQRASFLRELQCSEDNVQEENCVDIEKIPYATDAMKNSQQYFPIFRFSTISIIQIFPSSGGMFPTNQTIYQASPDTISSRRSTFIPITLRDYVERKSYFGIMVVEVYTQ